MVTNFSVWHDYCLDGENNVNISSYIAVSNEYKLPSTQLFTGFYQCKLHGCMFRPIADHLQASKWHKHKTAIANSFYGNTEISRPYKSRVN